MIRFLLEQVTSVKELSLMLGKMDQSFLYPSLASIEEFQNRVERRLLY